MVRVIPKFLVPSGYNRWPDIGTSEEAVSSVAMADI